MGNEGSIVIALLCLIVSLMVIMLLFWREVSVIREHDGVSVTVTAYGPGDLSPGRLRRVMNGIRSSVESYLDAAMADAGSWDTVHIVDPVILTRDIVKTVSDTAERLAPKERRKPFVPRIIINIIISAD